MDFFRAINVDDASKVKQLLDRGFDPNTVDEKGQVGLYLAFRDESPKAVAVLLAHPRTRIDAVNNADETPLMMAALRGQLDGARQLLDRGAAHNRPGWTPLHYAASGPEPRMVALLLERGAQVEALSPNRSTPLMMAARYGPEEAVDLLLARGASLRARNDADLGAVEFAELAGRDSLAARLRSAAR
ncbi:MAG: ankyrin repeat domain-containing protein [Rubrivivax sp.]|nr:ankyrin repeat domain-containing protein [Rubrivivax sp.]